MLASSFMNAKTAKPCSVQRPETAAFIAHMGQSSARLFKNSTGVALDGQHPGATSDMPTKKFTRGRIKKADNYVIGEGEPGPITRRLVKTYWAWHADPAYSLRID